MASFAGRGEGSFEGEHKKIDLEEALKDLGTEIATLIETQGVAIHPKNYPAHLSLRNHTNTENSVLSPAFSAEKLCNKTFKHYSTLVLKVPPAAADIRIYVTASYDRYLGWSNFDQSVHKSGVNEDSIHFLAIYTRRKKTGQPAVLSLEVSQTEFLTKEENSEDTYCIRREKRILKTDDIRR